MLSLSQSSKKEKVWTHFTRLVVGKSICALPFIYFFIDKVAFAHPLFIFPIPTTHMLTFIVQFEEIVLAFGIFFCPLFIAFLIVCPQQPPQQIIINYHKCRTLFTAHKIVWLQEQKQTCH